MRLTLSLLVIVLLMTCFEGYAQTPVTAPSLPAYQADLSQSSISGLSSGGFMAVQFHVAFSSTLVGVGVVAGGPYYCARGAGALLWKLTLPYRIRQCMNPSFGVAAPNATYLSTLAQDFAKERRIDPLTSLQNDRVYIFSGLQDGIVTPRVVEQTRNFYELAGVDPTHIRYINDVAAGHGFVTEDFGVRCDQTQSPFINDCDRDEAGAILQHIYGPLNPPIDPSANGKVIPFSQAEFTDSPAAISMSETGYAYVPNTCAAGTECRVHIALHGCSQGTDDIDDHYVTQTGYNTWAASNTLIVLYPQAKKTGTWFFHKNPKGCWDWWGYTGRDYAYQKGPQMAAIMAMLKRLSGTE